jgi:hypothetical protein
MIQLREPLAELDAGKGGEIGHADTGPRISPCSSRHRGVRKESIAVLRHLLLLPSFLCLDAPFVALGWALLLSPSPAGAHSAVFAALFLAVWIVYLCDRIFDSLRPDKDTSSAPPARLAWARKHRRLLAALALGAGTAATVVVGKLPPATASPGWILLGATALYFLLFRGSRIRRGPAGFIPAKELAIGTVFAFGVLLAARGGGGLSSAPVPLVSMALLFSGNCLLIARTETSSDRSRDEAAYFSVPAAWRFLPEAFLLAAAALALAFAPSYRDTATIAVFVPAMATLALSWSRRGAVPQALADALLLLPWLLVPLARG